MKRAISFLLCLIMAITLPGLYKIRADENVVKKIIDISAEYIGEKDVHGNVVAGKVLTAADFKFKIKYDGSEAFEDAPAAETANFSFTPATVPSGGQSGAEIVVSYNDTSKTRGNEVLKYSLVIQKTDEVLERLEANWTGATKYYVGDEIKKGEIILKGVYKIIGGSQTTKPIRNGFDITPSAITAAGANTIKVTYEGKETTVRIEGYGVKELEVTYSGDKNIVVGSEVDTKKIKASIVYTNNDKKTINNKDLSFENLEIKKTGPQDVIVKYGSLTGKLAVNGIAKNPDKISAKYTGTDLVVGTKIDPSKITLEITNNDKTKERITTGFTISPETVTQIGSNTITVTYKGYTDTVTIKGTEMLPTSLVATYNGGAVIEGQTINKSSILVTAYYPNGTNKTVSDFELSSETMNKIGVQEVVVKYKNLTSTVYIPVTAKMVTQLEAVYNGGAMEQFESLDRKKLIVTATFNDGSRSNVSDYILSSTTASKVGENLFNVNYGGKMANFTVEAFARRITGMGTLKADVGTGDYSTTITAFIQDQVVREGIKLETEEIEDDIIKPAIKRVNHKNTKKYIAFDMNVDDFQFDENKYMTAEFTVPEDFDPAKVAIFYTPDRKKTMIQLTGGLVAAGLYRFYVYESGSYVIMENNNNDVTMQEMRDSDQRKPLLVVAIDKKLPLNTKSKIKPYVLFSPYKNEEYTYEVDNEDILTVSKTGEMTTKAEGTASVTITAKSAGLSETYEIKVKK